MGAVAGLAVTEVVRELARAVDDTLVSVEVADCWVEGAASKDETAVVGGGGRMVAVRRAAVVVSDCVTDACSETVGTSMARLLLTSTEAGGKTTDVELVVS